VAVGPDGSPPAPDPSPNALALLRLAVGVEVVDEDHARGDTSLGGTERPGLFGGQMVAQSLSACAHTVPVGAVPDSIHVNFLGNSRAGAPIDFRIERVRDGRALQHRDVRGYQEDRPILQASIVSSIPSEGLNWQLASHPEVGAPDTSPTAPRPWTQVLGWGAFEMVYPSGEGERPDFPLWFRAKVASEDAWLQSAAVAFWSDCGMNWAARADHIAIAGPMSSVSATHGLWFHRPTRVEQWHLFDAHSHSFFGNQGFVRASLFDGEGRLIATVDQGVFIARTPAPRGEMGERHQPRSGAPRIG
jgi:acyl-CoA thioesterase-2